MIRKTKTASLLLSLLLIISFSLSVSAITVDYSLGSAVSYNKNQTFSGLVEDINPDSDFYIKRRLSDNSTDTLGTYQSTSLGRFNFNETIKPYSNSVAYNLSKGYNYEIWNSSIELKDIYISYGFDFFELDSFNYDSIPSGHSCYVSGEYSASKIFTMIDTTGDLKNDSLSCFAKADSANTGDYQARLTLDPLRETESYLFNMTMIAHIGVADSVDNSLCFESKDGNLCYDFNTGNSGSDVSFQFKGLLAFNDSELSLYGYVNGDVVQNPDSGLLDSLSTTSNALDFNVSFNAIGSDAGAGPDIRIHSLSIVPFSSFEGNYTSTFTSPITAGTSDRRFTWTDYTLDYQGDMSLEFMLKDSWLKYWSDVKDQTSNYLSTKTTRSGPLTNLFYLSDKGQEYMNILYPEDGDQFETETAYPNITFNYNGIPDLDIGKTYLQFKKSSKSWSTDQFSSAYNLEDLDGSCVTNSLSFKYITKDCEGHRIKFRQTSELFETLPPGTVDLRIAVNLSSSTTDESKEGTLYYSDSITLEKLQKFSEVYAVYPKDSYIYTSLKPEFILSLASEQGGSLSLFIDSNKQKTWILDNPTISDFSYTPSSGLTEGTHSYYGFFKGQDNSNTTSKTKNFTINTSLAGQVNFSLISPTDGYNSTDRDIDLSYSVESANSGTLNLWIDNEKVDSYAVTSGLTNKTTTLSGFSTGDHSWFLTFKDDITSNTYQSDVNQFTIKETVDLSSIEPKDSTTLDNLPVNFKGYLESNVGGKVELIIDDQSFDSFSFSNNYNSSFLFTVEENLSSGNHYWKFKFTSTSDYTYSTDLNKFNLLVGDKEEGAGGSLGVHIGSSFSTLFGITLAQSLAVVSLLISLSFAVTAGIFVKRQSGIVASIVLLASILTFTFIGWFPAFLTFVLAIIGGFIIAKTVTGGS